MTRTLTAATIAALTLAAFTGCSASSEPPDSGTSESAASPFPRTVEIPAGRSGEAHSLTIEHAPQAIAALDYESAETLAELGLGDRLVLVPEAVLNPALGGHLAEMEQVPHKFPVAMNLDTETVISAAPDLVVMSPRHGAEATIGAVLEQAGLTTLQLPDPWTSPEVLSQNIDLIGQTTGTEQEAQELTERIADGLSAHAAKQPGSKAANAPRVLVLTNQAGRPFATAGDAFPIHLLDLAGAVSVSDELGMETTGPISAEQIVEADPDGILLVDMNGTGDRMYSELLANPAVASLTASAEDRLMRVTGSEVQALGLANTVTGLDALSSWVATLT